MQGLLQRLRPKFQVNYHSFGQLLLYSFGMPMLAALILAARAPTWKRHLLVGYLVLVPFIAWGGLADFLKNIAITAGPQVASQTGFSAGEREVIAFAFQFGSLILPAIVPAIVWVLMHRRFLDSCGLAARDAIRARSLRRQNRPRRW